jgi:hypothetical protein
MCKQGTQAFESIPYPPYPTCPGTAWPWMRHLSMQRPRGALLTGYLQYISGDSRRRQCWPWGKHGNTENIGRAYEVYADKCWYRLINFSRVNKLSKNIQYITIITLPWPVISSNCEHDLNWFGKMTSMTSMSWNDFDVAHGQKCPGHVSSWLTTGLHCSTARAWWIQATKASPRRMACASEATSGRPANLEAGFLGFFGFLGIWDASWKVMKGLNVSPSKLWDSVVVVEL